MPSWLAGINLGQVAAVGGGAVFVIALITKAWKTIRPVFTGVREFLEDWRGEPERPGVPARPGMMQRMATTEKKLDAIDHELHPNSGESLRDQVDKIEKQLREHIAQQQG